MCCCSFRGFVCLFTFYAVLLLLLTTALDIICLVSINAPFLFTFNLSETADPFSAFQQSQLIWNQIVNGIHVIELPILWNFVLCAKLLLRLLLFITLPLMVIGNRTGRSSYLGPFKWLQLLTVTFAFAISVYFFFWFTNVELYTNLPSWLPKFFENPTDLLGRDFAKLFFLLTLSDGGPLCILFTLLLILLISKRSNRIRRKKDQSTAPTTWGMQLRPFTNMPKDEDMSPLSAHFNQVPTTSGTMSSVSHALNHSPVSSSEQINVNTAPFSYTNKIGNGNGEQTSAFYDNRAFQRN